MPPPLVGHDIFFCKLKKYSFHLQAHKITALHHRQCKIDVKATPSEIIYKKWNLEKITKIQKVKKFMVYGTVLPTCQWNVGIMNI
jgi:hypothetical protein